MTQLGILGPWRLISPVRTSSSTSEMPRRKWYGCLQGHSLNSHWINIHHPQMCHEKLPCRMVLCDKCRYIFLFFWCISHIPNKTGSRNHELPSGELTFCHGKIHHFSWENPLFLWPFSIAMLVHQRVLLSFSRLAIYISGSQPAP